MKADVINALTGLTVLAVPGVNSLTQLEAALTELRSEGLVEIKTAFDMDFTSNHNVQNGYNNLLQMLGDMGFRYGTYLWDPTYKGLDDYIWEYLSSRNKSHSNPFGVRRMLHPIFSVLISFQMRMRGCKYARLFV